MKNNCNIVKDLLPLYIDEVCSKESRELVEKHLSTCKNCRKELDDLKEDLGISNDLEVNIFKKFIKTINIRIAMRVIISSTIICFLIMGIYLGIRKYSFAVEYNDSWNIAIRGNKNNWNFQLNNTAKGNTYAEIVKINENGEDIYLVFLTIRANINSEFKAGTPDMDYSRINIDEDTMRVYYTKEDLSNISKANEDEINKIINNSIYIFNNEKKATTMHCDFNNDEFDYTITYYDKNGQILDSYGDNTIPNKINLYNGENINNFEDLWWTYKSAHDIFKDIEKFVTDNNGTCTKKENIY